MNTHNRQPLATSVPVAAVPSKRRRLQLMAFGLLLAAAAFLQPARATTTLADQPVFTNTAVPGNLVLALSVEFPTAVSVAHQGAFVAGTRYLGYFDYAKCYRYVQGTEVGNDVSHFNPVGTATALFKCTDTGLTDTWSGSFLNWLTMQAIDPFRWALTGGYRRVDTTTTTILERAWATNNTLNGSDSNFPLIPTADASPLRARPTPSSGDIADHTPLSFSSLRVSVRTRGNQVWFTSTATLTTATTGTPTHYSQGSTPSASSLHMVYARVKVCDSGTGYAREANCKAYPAGGYKPEGLLQQYAEKIRFSAFGYLNDPTDNNRDGGVLRARQKFVGPNRMVPGSPPVVNTATEWDANSGVQITNPDSTDASATTSALGVTVSNSGVINYLNKFGQVQQSYKRRDPVSELYYGALRYLKNQGSVPLWSDIASDTNKVRLVDGFPVITNWDDPIQYSCQKNFILGIGDTNTNWDRNLPGSTTGSNEAARPPEVTADTTVNSVTATNKVGSLEGLGASLGTASISAGSYLIAGLAYDAHTRDIRPDDTSRSQTMGMQTVTTYWLDVLEFGNYAANNQYYLAAKYGGFTVPTGYDPYTRTAALPEAWWRSNTDLVGTQPRPDNYFTASRPDQVVAGLTAAFASISAALSAYTTSFATALPQTAVLGTASYGAQFDSGTWTGEVQANTVSFSASTGEPTLTLQWSFSTKLAAQLIGTGWDTDRRMVTWNPSTSTAVPFRIGNLSSTQSTALDTVYRAGSDSADYLNYLRGDPTNEESSTATGSARIYRNRAQPVGDIVGSKVRPVGNPQAPFSDAANPGYGRFKTDYTNRTTMLYVGTNAGVLHGIDGRLTGSTAGREVFAYVPSALYQGPNGTPGVDGLAARGDPDFTHKPYVDGPPAAFDIDFGRTPGGTGTDWRTVLVGSLGKGGKSYFAIDVTDPAAMSSESSVASKVLWEFSHADLGYTYGEPTAVKTRKYGWVLIFGSGYNNADGRGYFFIVNPRTGALLERIGTGVGSTSSSAGLAHVQSYILDRSDGTADAVYAGDLLGNLWRLDVTAPTGPYPAPTQMAQLTNGAGNAVPVTSRPLVVVHPRLNRRYVVVGSGRLLDSADISSTQPQIFAAYLDGNANGFNSSAMLPSGISFPIQRSNLVQHTNLTLPVVVNPATQMGWWVDLGTSAAGNGWRVISDASSFYGVVTFVAMLPNGDACNPSGTSRVYSVDVGTGESQLIDASGATIAYSSALSGVVIEHRTYSVNGVPRLIACNDTGLCAPLNRRASAGLGLRRLNWRELPLAD